MVSADFRRLKSYKSIVPAADYEFIARNLKGMLLAVVP
jgi:hypothetical protein